jgi:Family of unknown function (DUF5681)
LSKGNSKSVLTPKRTPNPKSLKNLKPAWQPGESGNPSGRPKSEVTDAYRFLARCKVPGDPEGRTYAERLAEAQFWAAIGGATAAAREITDRLEGKSLQRVEVGNLDETPLELNLTVKFSDPEPGEDKPTSDR